MKTKLILLVLLLAATATAGEIFMPRIKYKTHEGLESQVKKILAVEEYRNVSNGDLWITYSQTVDELKKRGAWIVSVDSTSVEYYPRNCYVLKCIVRQFLDLEIVREPIHRVSLRPGMYAENTLGILNPVYDTTDVIGEAILIYEEVEK